MTTLERKNKLKEQIDFTTDESLLDKIEKLLKKEDIYVLSKEQLLRVEEATAEYERGESISHEQQEKEIQEWFKSQEK